MPAEMVNLALPEIVTFGLALDVERLAEEAQREAPNSSHAATYEALRDAVFGHYGVRTTLELMHGLQAVECKAASGEWERIERVLHERFTLAVDDEHRQRARDLLIAHLENMPPA